MESVTKCCKEELIELKELCDCLCQGNAASTDGILAEHVRYLQEGLLAEPEERKILLTGLNRTLYNYVLEMMNQSLYQCCFENNCAVRDCHSQESFLMEARQIADSYLSHLEKSPCNNCYIVKAQDYITRNLDKALTLEEVSSHIYISKAYLSELFPVCTGKSFTAYVCACRMKLAAQLLVSTALPIQSIGKKCGFFSPAYFSTSFAKQYGMSPRKFRTEKLHARELIA